MRAGSPPTSPTACSTTRSRTKSGTTFEVPNLGTITIGDKNVMNTQAELTTFDAKNIDDFNF